MQIQVTNGYITGYAAIGGFPDGIEASGELIDSLEADKIGCYRYENGQAVFDEEKYMEAQEAGIFTGGQAGWIHQSHVRSMRSSGGIWRMSTSGSVKGLTAWNPPRSRLEAW